MTNKMSAKVSPTPVGNNHDDVGACGPTAGASGDAVIQMFSGGAQQAMTKWTQ